MDARLGKRLVLDELFDLSLYKALRSRAPGPLQAILDQLIPIETRHYQFWRSFFGLEIERLDLRVGVSYVIGAVVPLLPVLFGARTLWPSLIVAGGVIVLVSTLLAFLSGMDVKRRILMNLGVIAAAVALSYAIGLLAQRVWGVSV
ncbi:MAG: hypothetical protein WEG40_01070 [Candidatus Rokuibacteriota bacterium]